PAPSQPRPASVARSPPRCRSVSTRCRGAADAEARVQPPRPLDLDLTLAALGSSPSLRHDGGAIWRATRTPLGAATLQLEKDNGSIVARAWGPGAEWAVVQAPVLCGEQDDDSGFIPAHPLIARLHREI